MTEHKYFSGGPLRPLRVEAGRAIVDSDGRVVLMGVIATDRSDGVDGGKPRPLGAADTDTFVRELVEVYNAYPRLVGLVRTVMRELSPASAAGFQAERDVPRIYIHTAREVIALRLEPEVGAPAVMEIPPLPDDIPAVFEQLWSDAWRAGYNAAWQICPKKDG